MVKRLTIVSIIVLVMVLPVLSSLSISSAQDETTLRWRSRPDNQAEIDLYQSISDTLDENWEGVTLMYEPGGSESASYQDVLQAELEAGTAPDVFWIPGTDMARFAKSGFLLNLAPYAEADEEFSTEDYYGVIMDQLTVSLDGEPALWGVPRDVSAFAIYYNADLFDQAGLDYPSGDWTWDDLYAAAEAIRALGDDTYGFGMNAWWANWGYFANAGGGSFFNEDYSACGLDNEGTAEGLNFAASLFQNDLAVPWGEDAEAPFTAGKLGMFINGRWATPNLVANATFNWNVGEMPAGPAGQSNWLFWGAYAVNADTEHPEEAWELVKQLTSLEVQTMVTELGANIPSRIEGRDAFLATFPDSGLNNEAFANGTDYGVAETTLWTGNWPAIDQAYGAGVTAVFKGEMTGEDFAATICGQVADQFESVTEEGETEETEEGSEG